MAKIVKVTMTRMNNNGRIHNGYPTGYDHKKIRVIAYENINDASKPYCIGVIADEDLAAFTVTADIEEVTQEQAITLGEAWRPQKIGVTDWRKIVDILEKVHSNTALSLADRAAIDPDDEADGLSRTRSFTNHLTDAIGAIDG